MTVSSRASPPSIKTDDGGPLKTKAFGHPESPLARRPSSCPHVVRLHATQQTSSLLLARPPASLWRPIRYVIRASCPAWLPLSSCHVSLRVLALLSGWTFSFSVCLCCCCCWLCRGPFFCLSSKKEEAAAAESKSGRQNGQRQPHSEFSPSPFRLNHNNNHNTNTNHTSRSSDSSGSGSQVFSFRSPC